MIVNIKPKERGADIEENEEVVTEATPTSEIVEFGTGWIKLKTAEGTTEHRSGGTISWRYNNPGNLKHGPFAKEHGSIGPGDGGHAVFPSLTIGQEAMKTLVFSPARGFDKMSIVDMLKKYAPTSDGNDPIRYASFVAGRIGVNPSFIIGKLSKRQQADMIEAMKVAEGFKVGEVSYE